MKRVKGNRGWCDITEIDVTSDRLMLQHRGWRSETVWHLNERHGKTGPHLEWSDREGSRVVPKLTPCHTKFVVKQSQSVVFETYAFKTIKTLGSKLPFLICIPGDVIGEKIVYPQSENKSHFSPSLLCSAAWWRNGSRCVATWSFQTEGISPCFRCGSKQPPRCWTGWKH